jgi:hypothetical protein
MITESVGHRALLATAVVLAAWAAPAMAGDLKYVTPPPSPGRYETIYHLRKPRDPNTIGLTHPEAMVVKIGALQVAVDAEKANAAKLDIARVDLTGKGNFADALTLPFGPTKKDGAGTQRSFGPKTSRITRNGRAIPVTIKGCYYKHSGDSLWLGLQADVVAEGECGFGKAVRKVRVWDRNADLKIAPAKAARGEVIEPDGLHIADKDGKFRPQESNYTSGLFRQPNLVDGTWYVVTVKDRTITASPIPGGAGKLTIDAPQWNCVLVGKKYYFTVNGDRTPLNIPADTYTIHRFNLNTDVDGGIAGGRMDGLRSKPFTITRGRTTKLPLGSTVTAKLSTRSRDGKVLFILARTDATGAAITQVYGAGKRRPAIPSIEVVDKSGKTVYTAEMEFG